MAEVSLKGVKGQLERTVDDQGRIYVGEWKGQDVVVLLKPREYEKITNEQIEIEIPSIVKRFKKDDLLREVEKELGLQVVARGYRPNDGTFSKDAMAEVLLGIWRLKKQLKINTE
jgi:hypothetical protein